MHNFCPLTVFKEREKSQQRIDYYYKQLGWDRMGWGWGRLDHQTQPGCGCSPGSFAVNDIYQTQSEVLHVYYLLHFFTLYCWIENTTVWSGNHNSFLSVSLCT
jgi:hypothetical protein